jgi:hypothetical protein
VQVILVQAACDLIIPHRSAANISALANEDIAGQESEPFAFICCKRHPVEVGEVKGAPVHIRCAEEGGRIISYAR